VEYVAVLRTIVGDRNIGEEWLIDAFLNGMGSKDSRTYAVSRRSRVGPSAEFHLSIDYPTPPIPTPRRCRPRAGRAKPRASHCSRLTASHQPIGPIQSPTRTAENPAFEAKRQTLCI